MERYHEVNICELKHLSQGSIVNDNLADDLFVAEMHYESKMDVIEYPCRFHGYLAFFCIKGEFEVEINLILEAKNLLKYSDMSIKSIVYELNFPNQTTFYRFFKTKTGMTPSEYRKM